MTREDLEDRIIAVLEGGGDYEQLADLFESLLAQRRGFACAVDGCPEPVRWDGEVCPCCILDAAHERGEVG